MGTFILPPGVGVRLGGVGGGGGWEGAVLGLTTPVSRRAPSGGSRHVSVTSWCPPCLLLPPVPASPRPLTSPVPTSHNPPLSPCPSPGHTAALSAAPSAADPGGPQVPGEAVPGSLCPGGPAVPSPSMSPTASPLPAGDSTGRGHAVAQASRYRMGRCRGGTLSPVPGTEPPHPIVALGRSRWTQCPPRRSLGPPWNQPSRRRISRVRRWGCGEGGGGHPAVPPQHPNTALSRSAPFLRPDLLLLALLLLLSGERGGFGSGLPFSPRARPLPGLEAVDSISTSEPPPQGGGAAGPLPSATLSLGPPPAPQPRGPPARAARLRCVPRG